MTLIIEGAAYLKIFTILILKNNFRCQPFCELVTVWELGYIIITEPILQYGLLCFNMTVSRILSDIKRFDLTQVASWVILIMIS